ncbi:MAG: beta/gamma crystallin family protein [Chloracidobacterium sp.]|nr:beta/gamma crystallin family protein [Chloracidobacterium sp.]
MKTRFNWLFAASIAVVFVLGGTIASFAQEDRFFGGNGITVFVDKNFKGNTQTFQNDVPDLSSYGLDRKISSFRAGNNEEWQICDGKRYSGRCASVSGEEYDLSINGWNDRIRSFRRTSGSGGGGQTSTPPSWAQGTFYGTAPDGSQIVLTITRNGQVTANINGSMSYGTYYRGDININGAQSNVSQSGNGIRTRRNDNGETINYSRNSWGGGWNGNGQTSTPPSWAQGTFYGTAPDGSQITLTIAQNGQVTANVNGSMSYGTYYRGNLNMNGAQSNVSQSGNGISTRRKDNGETINYSRNGWGNGGWGGGNNPVSWAVGTFNAENPQTGGTIYLTISRDGKVTVNMDGNMSYGTLNGTTLTINGATATVQKNGNGIRTVRNDNGERINYRRN